MGHIFRRKRSYAAHQKWFPLMLPTVANLITIEFSTSIRPVTTSITRRKSNRRLKVMRTLSGNRMLCICSHPAYAPKSLAIGNVAFLFQTQDVDLGGGGEHGPFPPPF
uniref:(northern house mosquito) hypothetical protein n=1 Tax=Culex pipiens TaxID=7175 RepID=A0A8D8GAF5_CULPI